MPDSSFAKVRERVLSVLLAQQRVLTETRRLTSPGAPSTALLSAVAVMRDKENELAGDEDLRHWIYYVASLFIKDRAERDDVYQEASLAIISKLNNFNRHYSFFTWVWTITKHIALKHLPPIPPEQLAAAQAVIAARMFVAIGADEADKVCEEAGLTPEERAVVLLEDSDKDDDIVRSNIACAKLLDLAARRGSLTAPLDSLRQDPELERFADLLDFVRKAAPLLAVLYIDYERVDVCQELATSACRPLAHNSEHNGFSGLIKYIHKATPLLALAYWSPARAVRNLGLSEHPALLKFLDEHIHEGAIAPGFKSDRRIEYLKSYRECNGDLEIHVPFVKLVDFVHELAQLLVSTAQCTFGEAVRTLDLSNHPHLGWPTWRNCLLLGVGGTTTKPGLNLSGPLDALVGRERRRIRGLLQSARAKLRAYNDLIGDI